MDATSRIPRPIVSPIDTWRGRRGEFNAWLAFQSFPSAQAPPAEPARCPPLSDRGLEGFFVARPQNDRAHQKANGDDVSDVKPAAPSPAQLAQQARAKTPVEVTGAQSLVLSSSQSGWTPCSGSRRGDPPGLRPAADSVKVRHILVRHEQGAGHAAEGYASATGRVGAPYGDLRPGCHEPRQPHCRRAHGLGAHGGHHRPGELGGNRNGCLPGGGHPGASRCRSPSTTTSSPTPTTSRG